MMRLSRDRVMVCFTRTDQADEQACRTALSPEELEKTDAFRSEKDRRLSIVARAQIRYLLSELTGEPAASLVIVRDENGRPRVRPGTPGADISFNISHTRGMVISALGRPPALGIDMEKLDRKVNLNIAGRFFSKEETAQIMAAPAEDRPGLFLRFWTLKEAWVKARGRGLALGLDRISFDLSGPGRIYWSMADGRGAEEEKDWQFFQFSPVRGALAALAVRAPETVTVETYHCIPFESLAPAAFEIIADGR